MRVRSLHERLDEMPLSGNLQTHFVETGKGTAESLQDTISYSDANVQ